MIKEISFLDILPIWENYLWYNRQTEITATSAMDFLGGYHLDNMNYQPVFIGYFNGDNLLGVNSGHKCRDNSYRSRGLYVHQSYRKQGIATKLLKATIELGALNKCNYVWSYPRDTSWNAYANAGFVLSSEWGPSELGKNAYCRIDLLV
jgi:GNAT superfamily N-acetyltransferase